MHMNNAVSHIWWALLCERIGVFFVCVCFLSHVAVSSFSCVESDSVGIFFFNHHYHLLITAFANFGFERRIGFFVPCVQQKKKETVVSVCTFRCNHSFGRHILCVCPLAEANIIFCTLPISRCASDALN